MLLATDRSTETNKYVDNKSTIYTLHLKKYGLIIQNRFCYFALNYDLNSVVFRKQF